MNTLPIFTVITIIATAQIFQISGASAAANLDNVATAHGYFTNLKNKPKGSHQNLAKKLASLRFRRDSSQDDAVNRDIETAEIESAEAAIDAEEAKDSSIEALLANSKLKQDLKLTDGQSQGSGSHKNNHSEKDTSSSVQSKSSHGSSSKSSSDKSSYSATKSSSSDNKISTSSKIKGGGESSGNDTEVIEIDEIYDEDDDEDDASENHDRDKDNGEDEEEDNEDEEAEETVVEDSSPSGKSDHVDKSDKTTHIKQDNGKDKLIIEPTENSNNPKETKSGAKSDKEIIKTQVEIITTAQKPKEHESEGKQKHEKEKVHQEAKHNDEENAGLCNGLKDLKEITEDFKSRLQTLIDKEEKIVGRLEKLGSSNENCQKHCARTRDTGEDIEPVKACVYIDQNAGSKSKPPSGGNRPPPPPQPASPQSNAEEPRIHVYTPEGVLPPLSNSEHQQQQQPQQPPQPGELPVVEAKLYSSSENENGLRKKRHKHRHRIHKRVLRATPDSRTDGSQAPVHAASKEVGDIDLENIIWIKPTDFKSPSDSELTNHKVLSQIFKNGQDVLIIPISSKFRDIRDVADSFVGSVRQKAYKVKGTSAHGFEHAQKQIIESGHKANKQVIEIWSNQKHPLMVNGKEVVSSQITEDKEASASEKSNNKFRMRIRKA